MFNKLIQKLKENPRTIVFTEGSDPRILEASSRLLLNPLGWNPLKLFRDHLPPFLVIHSRAVSLIS